VGTTEQVQEGDEGILYLAPKEPTDFFGKHDAFQGKSREQWHPFDKKTGTGRGKELPKGGHGKGNWGNLDDELKATGLVIDESELPTSTEMKSKIVVAGDEDFEIP
jgi:hypothetical protein